MRRDTLTGLLAMTALVALVVPAGAQTATRDYAPVTNDVLLDPPDGDWIMWRRTLNNWGYSPLNQVNRDNVENLELAWAWPMAELGQQELAPIERDGIIFLATNNNVVEALDAATGDLIWTYRNVRPDFGASAGYHNGQVTRQKNSVALWGENVILTTVDARLISLDAVSGEVVWDLQVNDWQKGYSYTAGPLVADGKIFTGTSGCSITGTAGACWITAHNADTGEEIWRFNTLGDPNNPLVDESWRGVPLENRWGATPWATGAYDPDLDLVYYGTGMPIPYTEISRGTGDGDVLYTNSTLAIEADTGTLRWYFQHLPRDNWDLDSPFERLLIDAEIGGTMRNLLVSVPGKMSIAFGLDRGTGEFFWATDTVFQNVVSGIDEKTGRVFTNVATIPTAVGEEKLFCPAIAGGKLWMATAYSPDTGGFYIPVANTCQSIAPRVGVEFTPGNSVASSQTGPRTLPDGETMVGSLHVLDVVDGEHIWTIEQPARFTSSLFTTAGGIVFGGDAGRYFSAYNDETGELLWQVRLNAPIGGYPMTYEVDGVQYIAVPAGRSNQTEAAVTPSIGMPIGSGNSVFVFKLRNALR